MVEFDVEQNIKDKAWTKCGMCGGDELYRVIQTPIVFVKEGITDKTTLGKLAEINTNKLGTYEKQEKREYQRQQKILAKQTIQNEMSEKLGTSPIDMSDKAQPFYRKLGADKINKMSQKEKETYIQTGK
jgi:hypothetical protein